MIVGLADHLTPADLALVAYERALQPKRLVTVRGGHFDAYGNDFATASAAAVDWFLCPFGTISGSRPDCMPLRLAPPAPIDYQSPSGLRSLRLEA
jgi:hypothetical protein